VVTNVIRTVDRGSLMLDKIVPHRIAA